MALVISFKPKRGINLNELARDISKAEAGKKQVDIAQISEVLSHTLNLLGLHYVNNPRGVTALLEKRAAEAKAIIEASQ